VYLTRAAGVAWRVVADAQAKAQAEKELGNAAYKKKSFEEAIAHYNAAQELDGSDISFMTNRAAVYLEMGKFPECIADCDAAVEKGREMRADYKVRRLM
jgi:stress-induced-phosphoprotein 1